MNLVHASDGPEAARREVEIFFRPDEIRSYEPTIAPGSAPRTRTDYGPKQSPLSL